MKVNHETMILGIKHLTADKIIDRSIEHFPKFGLNDLAQSFSKHASSETTNPYSKSDEYKVVRRIDSNTNEVLNSKIKPGQQADVQIGEGFQIFDSFLFPIFETFKVKDVLNEEIRLKDGKKIVVGFDEIQPVTDRIIYPDNLNLMFYMIFNMDNHELILQEIAAVKSDGLLYRIYIDHLIIRNAEDIQRHKDELANMLIDLNPRLRKSKAKTR